MPNFLIRENLLTALMIFTDTAWVWAFLSASKPNGEWEWRGGGTFLKSSCWVSLVEFIPPLQGSSQKSGIHGMVRGGGRDGGPQDVVRQMLSQFHGSGSVGVGMGTMYICVLMPRPEYISVFGDWSTGSRTISLPCSSLRIGCSTWSLQSPAHSVTVLMLEKPFCLSFLPTFQFTVIG